jgi:hypothetical protein
VDRLAVEVGGAYLFQWRTELRRGLVAGRCALAMGQRDEAAACFDTVRQTAERLGLRRYLVLSRLWLALAMRPLPDSLESSVDELGRVAPLEAWWLTAELARAFSVDRWASLAVTRADDLARRSGPYAETLRRAVSADPLRSG